MDEAKKQRLAGAIKWAAGLGAVALATPAIYLALKGLLGLLALGVAAGAGLAMIRLAPWFGQFTTNLGLKLFMREVARNPIESMLSLYAEKTKESDEADGQIVEFETEIRNYADQVKTFQRQYPDEAQTFADIARQMDEALQSMKAEQKNARDGLRDLYQRIQKAQAIYKMSLAAQRVARLSKSAEAKVFAEIKEKVAFDAVQAQLNRSFAALSMAVSRRKQLQAQPAFLQPVDEGAAGQAQKTLGKKVAS